MYKIPCRMSALRGPDFAEPSMSSRSSSQGIKMNNVSSRSSIGSKFNHYDKLETNSEQLISSRYHVKGSVVDLMSYFLSLPSNKKWVLHCSSKVYPSRNMATGSRFANRYLRTIGRIRRENCLSN